MELSECYTDLKINSLVWQSIAFRSDMQQIMQIKKDLEFRKETDKPIKEQKFDIRELENIPFINIKRVGKKK